MLTLRLRQYLTTCFGQLATGQNVTVSPVNYVYQWSTLLTELNIIWALLLRENSVISMPH